ncbi:Phospholipase A1, partial [Gryllus bimaculatus]
MKVPQCAKRSLVNQGTAASSLPTAATATTTTTTTTATAIAIAPTHRLHRCCHFPPPPLPPFLSTAAVVPAHRRRRHRPCPPPPLPTVAAAAAAAASAHRRRGRRRRHRRRRGLRGRGVAERAVAAAVLVVLASLACSVAVAAKGRLAAAAQEAEDERRDAEILRAVVRSMDEWGRRAAARRAAAGANANATANATHAPLRWAASATRRLRLPGHAAVAARGGGHARFQVFASGGGGGAERGEGEGAGAGAGITAPLVDVAFANRSAVLALRGAFDLAKPTKVIVHGFGSSCAHVWVYEMRSALMAVEECNVICVDWEGGAAVPNYVRAAANTRLVGKQLALLLQASPPAVCTQQRVHTWLQLGAHVAGFAGRELRNLSQHHRARPRGPAVRGPGPARAPRRVRRRLRGRHPLQRREPHPGRPGLLAAHGPRRLLPQRRAHAEGLQQPLRGRRLRHPLVLCNHRRAYKFFTDSVSPRCHFPAFPCASYDDFLAGTCFPCSGARRCGNMGYYADRSSGRGALFLVTRDEEPFCAHQYSVRLESAAGEAGAPSSYGSLHITLAGDAPGLNETFPLTQKEDEQLKPGQSLTRLLVPHPALAAPTTATLVYTAYAGWWSSGLPAWPVRKLAIVDSFGKSMSVCRRDLLLLQTGVPTTLQLFPGECHPPVPPAASASAANASSAPTSTTSTAAPPPQAAAEKGEEAEKGAGAGRRADGAAWGTAASLSGWCLVDRCRRRRRRAQQPEDSRPSIRAPRAARPPGRPTAAAPCATHARPARRSAAPPALAAPAPPGAPADIKEPVLTPRTSPRPPRRGGRRRRRRRAGGSPRRRFSSEADTPLWIPAAPHSAPAQLAPRWRHWAWRARPPRAPPTPTPAHAGRRAPAPC